MEKVCRQRPTLKIVNRVLALALKHKTNTTIWFAAKRDQKIASTFARARLLG